MVGLPSGGRGIPGWSGIHSDLIKILGILFCVSWNIPKKINRTKDKITKFEDKHARKNETLASKM
jgi:hypothetical protein